MPFLKSFAPVCLGLCLVAAPAAAQSPLAVTGAELAVPFGAAEGHVALVGSQLLFVAAEDARQSLAIDRADIANLDRAGDVVTIRTRRALRDTSGDRDVFRFRLADASGVMSWYGSKAAMAAAPATPAPPATSAVLASYQVKHDHRLGSCQGTLILTADKMSFESLDEIDDSRQWALADIKEVDQSGAYKLKVVPFLGDTFNFELTGKGMDSGEFRRLTDRIARARSTS